MKKPSKIPHPLINRTGTSQRTRVIEALKSDSAPIDGKTLADRLYIISRYAQQINYYEYIKNGSEGEFQDIDNWNSFFKNNLAFQLAVLSRTSINDIENEYRVLHQELKNNPSKQALESLLFFVLNKIIQPTQVLFTKVEQEKNSFTTPLLGIIKSSFVEPLRTFVPIYNAAVTFLCVSKRDFKDFLMPPWQLKPGEIYKLDTTIQQSKKGKEEAIVKMGEIVTSLVDQLLIGFGDIVEIADDFIDEALRPLEASLQKKHQPHLGLLFAFLELFKNLKGNINDLGKKHLDFFYQHVLKIAPKDAIPDQAHIVFEIAKHLDQYLLKENLLLKNGKDANNEDIQFGLDQEIVLDKAQITDLRTLSKNTVIGNTYIEGVYIAPVANSADGVGKKFEKDQTPNWPTLGSKYSKLLKEETITEGEEQDQTQECSEEEDKRKNHPNGRLGFVLVSPVLLLQEGKRTINISLECTSDTNFIDKLDTIYTAKAVYEIGENIFGAFDTLIDGLTTDTVEYGYSELAKKSFKELIDKKKNNRIYRSDVEEFLSIKAPEDPDKDIFEGAKDNIRDLFIDTPDVNVINTFLFKFWFSGEKEWLQPNEEDITIFISSSPGKFSFEIQIDLALDFPSITFFNEEALKEKLDLKEPLPVLKVELNEKLKIPAGSSAKDPGNCALKGDPKTQESEDISPYHFLEKLQLDKTHIDVHVCGVKNLIVQNDESLLDIKSQIFPFGLRPEVSGFDPMNQLELVQVEGDSLLGPSFYIGSKEVLFKKWGAVRVNIEWKDKPDSFNDHYKAYLKRQSDPPPYPAPGDNEPPIETKLEDLGLNEEEFELKIDKLKDGSWISLEQEKQLFSKTDDDFGKLACETAMHGWEVQNNEMNRFIDFDEPLELFKNSRNGFLRFTMARQDFLHREYPFVLARQMLAYALSASAEEDTKLTDAIYVKSNKTVIQASTDLSVNTEVQAEITDAVGTAQALRDDLGSLATFITTNKPAIDAIISNIEGVISAAATYMTQQFPPFQSALENFLDTELPDPDSFTLAVFIDKLFEIKTDIEGLNNSLEVQDLITNTFAPFIQNLLTILKKPDPPADPDGLEGFIEIVINVVNDDSTTPENRLGLIKDPLDDIQEGILEAIALIEANNDPDIAVGLLAKLNAINGIVGEISSYITGNFTTVLDNLKLLVEDLDDKMNDPDDGLVQTFQEISGQLIAFNTQLAGFVGSAEIGGSLIFEFDNFIESILRRVVDEDEDGDLTDLADSVLEALTALDELFSTSNILGFLNDDALQALIPSEPWTPVIKNLFIDYSATAGKEDMDIIHLYPFENTSKNKDINNTTLFPVIDDNGTLFIGIENLTPGGNLSILFQLAEATANSELTRAVIEWQYLSENKWENLLPDFNIISDGTDGLTVSGIVSIAIPDDINKTGNTLMPDNLYWIKISTKDSAMAVAETIGIHTQAARASARLSELNDKTRLNEGLEAGSVSKLSEGDFSVKKVQQLYPTFDGRQPEGEGHFYVRVSEHLKHKGRALMLNDYEKIVLEGFPKIYKAKCISHTMGLSAIEYEYDLEIAPGYAVITVIPDLTKLLSGNQLEPKAPVSLLEKIGDHLRKKISPFARIKVMNPRYEKVGVDITVRLYRGKSKNFYKKQLKEDITNLLAPWFLGDSEKIAFGMPVLFSDVVGFVEQLDYIDFITNLKLSGEGCQEAAEIKPLTARSILTAGFICVRIDQEECPDTGTDTDTGNTFSLETTATNNESSELS